MVSHNQAAYEHLAFFSVPYFTFCEISEHPRIQCHFYVDETQIYLPFSLSLLHQPFQQLNPVLARDAFSWMILNNLSVNPNKAKYLLFNSNNINPSV